MDVAACEEQRTVCRNGRRLAGIACGTRRHVVLVHLMQASRETCRASGSGLLCCSIRRQVELWPMTPGVWRPYSHNPPDMWGLVLMTFAPISGLLWILATYLTIRFGLRDRMARTALASAILCTIILHLWWRPFVLTTCVLVAAIGLISAFAFRAERRPSLGILNAVAGSCLAGIAFAFCQVGIAFLFLAHESQRSVGLHVGPKELQEHPWMQRTVAVLYWLLMLLVAKTASWAHTWQARTHGTAPESVGELTTSDSSN